jgi:hypothetical protein
MWHIFQLISLIHEDSYVHGFITHVYLSGPVNNSERTDDSL